MTTDHTDTEPTTEILRDPDGRAIEIPIVDAQMPEEIRSGIIRDRNGAPALLLNDTLSGEDRDAEKERWAFHLDDDERPHVFHYTSRPNINDLLVDFVKLCQTDHTLFDLLLRITEHTTSCNLARPCRACMEQLR